MKTILDCTGSILIIGFIAYRFILGTKSVGEVFDKNPEKAIKTFHQSIGKITWPMLIGGVGCFLLSDWLYK